MSPILRPPNKYWGVIALTGGDAFTAGHHVLWVPGKWINNLI
jgi:hypothetical protein